LSDFDKDGIGYDGIGYDGIGDVDSVAVVLPSPSCLAFDFDQALTLLSECVGRQLAVGCIALRYGVVFSEFGCPGF
jgi:hypothetical protein